jgi:thioredoxin reductase (NADPH)
MADPQAVVLIGSRWAPRTHGIKDFLARNRVPYDWYDPAEPIPDPRVAAALEQADGATPLVLSQDGTIVVNPQDEELAPLAGLSSWANHPFYDLAIVGGGPAGLAAGVYGASEGLRVVIVEAEAPGGQAGMSARIDNYLGFPDGVEGSELARRAVDQAARFGAEILVARRAAEIRAEGQYRVVRLEDGHELVCSAVLVASGVDWRALDAPGCQERYGAGVYYGAASAEAKEFAGQDAFVLGGGNSAGQAAMLLARYAGSVTIVALEDSLEEKMSRYLIEELGRTPNVRTVTGSTISAVHGDGRVESVTIRREADESEETVPAHGLFVFIGAAPRTEWLEWLLKRDDQGFILCGARLREDPADWPLERDPFLLETSCPGVFVAGDVRAESIKRVASAVGEGAMAVQFVHEYLRLANRRG